MVYKIQAEQRKTGQVFRSLDIELGSPCDWLAVKNSLAYYIYSTIYHAKVRY